MLALGLAAEEIGSAGGLVDNLTGCRGGPVGFMTVERARHQTRGGRLSDTARAGKKISMMKPPVRDRILKGSGQDFLAGYVFKFLWAPLTCDNLIGHKSKYEG